MIKKWYNIKYLTDGINMENWKYRILTFIRYLGDSFYYPFVALYLNSRHLTESKIGLIIGISPLVGIILNPFFTYLCKNFKKTKTLLSFISIFEALAIVAIAFSSSFPLIVISSIMIAIFGACHYGLMDSVLTIYAENAKISYSTIRVMGSIAYIIGTLVGGILIKQTNYQLTFIIASALFIASGLFYYLLTPIEDVKSSEKVRFFAVFKNRQYLPYLLVFVLFMAICFSSDHFFSLFLKAKGLDESAYGFVYSYYVLIETITLLVLARFKGKLNGDWMILIAIVAMLIRHLVNFFDLNVYVIIVASGLRGLSVGIFFYAAYTYFLKLLGANLTTKGIMIANFGQLLGIFLMDDLNGLIIEKWGFQIFYLLVIILTFMLLSLQLVRMIVRRKENKLYI